MAPYLEKYNEIYATTSLQDKLLCQIYAWPLNTHLFCRFGSDPTFTYFIGGPIDVILRNLEYFIPNMILGFINLVLGAFGKQFLFHYSCILFLVFYYNYRRSHESHSDNWDSWSSKPSYNVPELHSLFS